ncbi:MAG: hypothetical protein R3A80_02320 [Bdellovibrionota bacterium]
MTANTLLEVLMKNFQSLFLLITTIAFPSSLFANTQFNCKCTAQTECYVLPTDTTLSMSEDGRLKIHTTAETPQLLIDAQRTSEFADINRDEHIFMNHAEYNILKQNLKFRNGNDLVVKDLLVMKRLLDEGEGYVKIHAIYVGDAQPITTDPFYDSLKCVKAAQQ